MLYDFCLNTCASKSLRLCILNVLNTIYKASLFKLQLIARIMTSVSESVGAGIVVELLCPRLAFFCCGPLDLRFII